MSRGVWPRIVSESISELSTDLMGRAEPVVEMAGQAGSGICTHLALLRRGRQDRSSQWLDITAI